MEYLKTYLPLLVIAFLGYFAIRKLGSSSGPTIRQQIPLTPTSEPAYSDPLLPFRAGGFAQLAEVAKSQIEGQTRRDIAKEQTQIESLRTSAGIERGRQSFDLGLAELDVRKILGLSGEETERQSFETQSDLSKFLQSARDTQQQFLQNAYLRQLQLFYTSREQDRQVQQSAIDRFFATRPTTATAPGNTAGGIISSISQAINGILRPSSGGGSIFRTPGIFG